MKPQKGRPYHPKYLAKCNLHHHCREKGRRRLSQSELQKQIKELHLLFIALLSYLFTGENDQSTLNDFTNRSTQTENWLSKIGAWISELLIYNGFGVFSFIFSGLVVLSGVSILANSNKKRLWRNWFFGRKTRIFG